MLLICDLTDKNFVADGNDVSCHFRLFDLNVLISFINLKIRGKPTKIPHLRCLLLRDK